jgi:hypothetical protein
MWYSYFGIENDARGHRNGVRELLKSAFNTCRDRETRSHKTNNTTDTATAATTQFVFHR